MLESKRIPREMVFGANHPTLIHKKTGNEEACNRLWGRIQNEGMNIKDISDKTYRISQKLKRISTNGSFRAVVAGLGATALSVVRLAALAFVGRRRRGRVDPNQALKESRRLLSAVQKTITSAKHLAKGNREMEALLRDLNFQGSQLKDRRARMDRLLAQQKRLRCLD